MRIAISKASGSPKYHQYGAWLQAANPTVEVVDLVGMPADLAIDVMSTCGGLLLSGGEDVHPDRYDEPEKLSQCGTIDMERDALELAVARSAIELNIPVLGICRGLQLLNVLYGGTLIADIPSDGYVTHTTQQEVGGHAVEPTMHEVIVEPGSMIKRICRHLDGTVNSYHHQAIERMASMFAPAAVASDGVVEAIEWGDAALGGKPFLLAVQWHPERMPWDSPFSLPIARHFIHEAEAYEALLR